MPNNKTTEFTDTEINISNLSKALAHPARIRILTILSQSSTCQTNHLVEQLPLSQSTVSQHLKELKQVGLIRGEIEGPKTCYCINPDAVDELNHSMNELLTILINAKPCDGEDDCNGNACCEPTEQKPQTRARAMENSTRELIAIGASVTANCMPCLDYHLKKGREMGISEKDLHIAIKTGEQVKAGAAKKMSNYANSQIQGNTSQSPVSNVCTPDSQSCC